jgi:hypothetical protein
MKTCTVCKEVCGYTYFYRSTKSKDGYGYRCKTCDNKTRLKYRANNKEKAAESDRRKRLKWLYGLTLEEYADRLEEQGNCCAICKTTESGVGGERRDWNWAVDHCHDTGKVRGLLCSSCNRGLGMLGDTEEALQRALDYLKDTH